MITVSAKFGRVVAKARIKQGLSQERVAELAGLDRTFISLIERGRRRATLETAVAIAQALGVSLSALLRRTERSCRQAGSREVGRGSET